MRIVLFSLIFCNLLVPLFYVARNNFRNRQVEIDHVLLFTFGFIFYWIFPIVAGVMGYFEHGYTLADWYKIFNRITDYNLCIYFISCLGCYISFVVADMTARKIFAGSMKNRISVNLKLLDILLVAGIIFSAIFGYTLRQRFFSGYTISAFSSWKGSFSASIVFILSLAFLYSTEIEEQYEESRNFQNVIFNRFFAVSFIGLVLLTSLGGRTFILSAIAMILVYRTVFFKRMKLRPFILCVLGITLLSGLMPLVREGVPLKKIFYSTAVLVHFKNLSFTFLSDSILTSYTLVSALRNNILPLVNAPIFLLGSFVNLIPTFLFPSKGALIPNPANYGYPSYTPYGGMNSFFYFMVNFGILGTVVALFLFALFLGLLKTQKIPVWKSMYIMISGWTAFALFRDPESAIIKMILEFSILVPVVILFLPIFLSRLRRFFCGLKCTGC